MTGCVICKKYEYIEEDSLSGFPGANSGWTCSVREIEDFKTFPCKRKLKCFEEIKEMSKARDEYYSLFESERVFTEVQNYVSELEQKVIVLTDSNVARDLVIEELQQEKLDLKLNLNKSILTSDIIDKLNQIYNHFGEKEQLHKLVLEGYEYIAAIKDYEPNLDYRRLGRTDEILKHNIYQEIADVFVLSAQLVLNNPDIQKQVEFKINRTLQRIADGYYKDM